MNQWISTTGGRWTRWPKARYAWAAMVAGAVGISVGGAHLGAWLGGTMRHRGAGAITMKTNAALGLLLLGVALVLVTPGPTGRFRRWTALAAAGLALLMGGLTLSENLIGWDLGLDQLLAEEPPGSLGVISPNRMGTPGSLGIALAGLALALLTLPARRAAGAAQAVAIVVFLCGLLGTIGHLYGTEALYGIAQFTAIAWPTALTLLILGMGILCVRPAEGLMAGATADDSGGTMIRRLLLPIILVPLGLGWLSLSGQRWGWYETAFGTALLTLLFIVIFSTLVYLVGRRISRLVAELASLSQFPAENPHPVLRMGRNGQLLYANHAARALLDREGRQPGSPVPDELRQRAEAAIAREEASEFELVCRDEQVIEMTCVPVLDRCYVNLYGRDVSQTRRAEKALRESELQYRALFANMTEGFALGEIILDGEHHPCSFRFLEANEAFERETGLKRDEVLGRPIHEVLPNVERHWIDTYCRVALTGESARFEHDNQDTNRHYSVFCYRPEPNRFAILFTDDTVRQRAETALRESESFYRQTLESIPGMVFTTRPDGYCDYQNRQWVEYTGVPLSEHLGDGWNKLLHPDDQPRAYAAWRAAVEGRAAYDLEYRVRRHDGQYEWFKVIGRPIRDTAGRIVRWFGTAINIEDLKRAEEDIRAARESAEHAKAVAELANRAKDHFLAVLSHELRTPLTPVAMAVSMLQDRTDLDAGVRETLEMMRRNVELEARLIDDLLDVSRIARGKVELTRSAVELCTVIQRAVEVCKPDLEARSLEFGVDLGPSAPYWVEADVPRLQQVFWNLLKNAIKFTPQGGCIGIRCRPNEEHVVVEVNDSGIGIEPEALPRVFNAFEQAERSITRQFGGLGLGLAISRALVEMHGGQIEAHSEGRNKGTTFRVRLPLAAPAGRPKASRPSVAPQRLVRPLRILLVEDHGVTAKLLRMVLAAEGHAVEMAGDVATALELADRHGFDLLVSDLGLPDGSGYDLMRKLRGRKRAFPGIALSGYGQEEDIRRSYEAGFAAHLTKPASREAVIEAIAVVAGSETGPTVDPTASGPEGE